MARTSRLTPRKALLRSETAEHHKKESRRVDAHLQFFGDCVFQSVSEEKSKHETPGLKDRATGSNEHAGGTAIGVGQVRTVK